nr:hypothetical protein XfCFBP8356_11280 [Xylella fastidiosa subsp. sandyi]
MSEGGGMNYYARPLGDDVRNSEPAVVRKVVRQLPDGFYGFVQDGNIVYEIHPADIREALRWIEHLAQKTWITKHHLEQFACIAADTFEMRRQ